MDSNINMFTCKQALPYVKKKAIENYIYVYIYIYIYKNVYLLTRYY